MKEITAEIINADCSAAAGDEEQKTGTGMTSVGIMELKMLISAITRFKYD